MLYINKYHNYNLIWGVIITSTVIEFYGFSYRATELNMQRRCSLRRDRCLHGTVVTEQTTKRMRKLKLP